MSNETLDRGDKQRKVAAQGVRVNSLREEKMRPRSGGVRIGKGVTQRKVGVQGVRVNSPREEKMRPWTGGG